MTFEELVEYVRNHSNEESVKEMRSYARKNKIKLGLLEGEIFWKINFS
jgi:hypothetical protein